MVIRRINEGLSGGLSPPRNYKGSHGDGPAVRIWEEQDKTVGRGGGELTLKHIIGLHRNSQLTSQGLC